MKTFASPRRGFTLSELLVVVTIIAVLVALLLPVINGATRSAENAECIVNLRTIAGGLQAYTAENDGMLPGPLFSGQGPFYNRDARRLQTRIGKYIGIPQAANWSTKPADMSYDKTFECPSARRKMDPKVGATTFSVNLSFKIDGLSPFGSGDADGNGTLDPAKDRAATAKYNMQSEVLAETWLLVEIDQQSPGLGKPGWINGVPVKPVHGNHRNAIFFDLHVGPVDLEELKPL